MSFGACFYAEQAKPRNVYFQRHFAQAGLYIVITHDILVFKQDTDVIKVIQNGEVKMVYAHKKNSDDIVYRIVTH